MKSLITGAKCDPINPATYGPRQRPDMFFHILMGALRARRRSAALRRRWRYDSLRLPTSSISIVRVPLLRKKRKSDSKIETHNGLIS